MKINRKQFFLGISTFLILLTSYHGTIFAQNTTITQTTITQGGSSCTTGGSASPCASVLDNNTSVTQSGGSNPVNHYTLIEGLANWQPSNLIENIPKDFAPIGGVVPISGAIENFSVEPGTVAEYICSIGGTLQPTITETVSGDGTWSASLPAGGTCTLEIISPNAPPPAGSPSLSECDGTLSNPCVTSICQTGQCVPITQYPDGTRVQPGDSRQCTDGPTQCLTHFTVSVSPVNATVNTGASAVYAVTFNFNNNKPYRHANISVSAPGLTNNNFSWSGIGYDNPTLGQANSNPSFGRLDMYNTGTGAIDQTRTLFLTVNNAPVGGYDLTFRASTGDVMGVNGDWSYNFANCFGNCNPTANAPLTVNLPSCTNSITTAPSNLTCGSKSSTGYTLSWNQAVATVPFVNYTRVSTSYDGVASGLCANPSSPSYDPVNCRNNVSSAVSTFPVTGLQPSTTYYNRIAAVCTNPDGSIGYKDTQILSCTTEPSGSSCTANPPVTNVSPVVLSSATGNITVTWSTIAGVPNYTVELRNSAGTLIQSKPNESGPSTQFSVTPAAGGTTYRIRILSNVTAPAVACEGYSDYVVTVYPPATSCPATPGTVILNKSSAAVGDFTVKAISPAGYNCSGFNSTDVSGGPGVASVNPASGNPSESFINLNNPGTASISGVGCVYQGGPTCAVNPTQLVVDNTLPGGYDFTITNQVNLTAMLVGGSIVLDEPGVSFDVRNTGSNPMQIWPVYEWNYQTSQPFSYPLFVLDSFVADTVSGYILNPGQSSNTLGQSVYPPDGLIYTDTGYDVNHVGTYNDSIAYAGYDGYPSDPPPVNKVTPNKNMLVTLTVRPVNSSNVSYTVSPANIAFSSTRNAGTLPSGQPTGQITVRNDSDETIILSVTAAESLNGTTAGNIPWADISTPDGNPLVLDKNETGRVNVTVNTTNPLPDTETSYTGSILFTEATAGSKTVGLTYNITSGGGSCTPVPGGVTDWSECSSGWRTRTCTNPVPSCGGAICTEDLSEPCGNNPQNVRVTPSACGYVESDPSGIDCGAGGGATCEASFPQDTEVELTAVASSRCVFIEWQGNCTGSNPVCDLYINGTKNVTPIFGLKPFFYQEF